MAGDRPAAPPPTPAPSASRGRARCERAAHLRLPPHAPDAPVDVVMMQGHAPAEPEEDVAHEVRARERHADDARPVPRDPEEEAEREVAHEPARRSPPETALVLPHDAVVLE